MAGCAHGPDSYGFARVHLETATFTKVACIGAAEPKGAVVRESPSSGGFSHDNARFATASGNGHSGKLQLLVFDAATGRKVLESGLPLLGLALGVSPIVPVIKVWGVAHMP